MHAAAITSVFALYNIEIISLIVVFCLLIALANSDDFCFWLVKLFVEVEF